MRQGDILDYLKEHGPADTTHLAYHFNEGYSPLSCIHNSVNSKLKIMERQGLVRRVGYGPRPTTGGTPPLVWELVQ